MKRKVIKYKSDLFQQEVTLTIDEKLNKLKGRTFAPGKLAKANKDLKDLKMPLPR